VGVQRRCRVYGLGFWETSRKLILQCTGLDLATGPFFENEWRYALHNARTYRKSAGNNNCILVNDTDQWGGGQVWHPRLRLDQVGRIAFFADGALLLTPFSPKLRIASRAKNVYTGKSGAVSWIVLVGDGSAEGLSSDAHLAVAAHDAGSRSTEVLRFGGRRLEFAGLSIPPAGEDAFATIREGKVTTSPCAMVRPGRDRLSGSVEVDEAYIGGKKSGKRGRGAAGKDILGHVWTPTPNR